MVVKALAAQGARSTRSIVAAAEASLARDPQAKAGLARDCAASLKDAEDSLAGLAPN